MGISAPPTPIPRIPTGRLVLRELRVTDFDAYAANMADPLATAHLSGTLDRRAAWRVFTASQGMWLMHGAGWWGVELAETGELVGSVGAFIRETSPELELGWMIHRPFWRRGFATEAARAALTHAFDVYAAPRVIAHVSASNVQSVGVSERLGLKYECDVDFYGETIGRYALDRSARPAP
jgi:RimJ/RimL family protein N-acetyltransferase